LAEITNKANLVVQVTGGRYSKLLVQVGNSQYAWWVRASVSIIAEFKGSSLLGTERAFVKPDKIEATNIEGLTYALNLFQTISARKKTDHSLFSKSLEIRFI